MGAKLTAILLLISTVPLAAMGYLAFDSGRSQLHRTTLDHLMDLSLLKQSEFDRWIQDSARSLRSLAQRPLVREYSELMLAHESTNSDYMAARQALLQDHFVPQLEEDSNWLALYLVGGSDGAVIVSTGASMETTSQRESLAFVQGKQGTYIGEAESSPLFAGTVMRISTPISDGSGETIAVLGAYVDLAEMTKIMWSATSPGSTEESYMINRAHFFITEPTLIEGAILQRTVHSEGANVCLNGQTGTGTYDDYRGVPVIGAYRWIPKLGVCLLTEIDQAEALAPIISFRDRLLVLGGMVVLGAGIAGLLLTRTITIPLGSLMQGVQGISEGDLDDHVPLHSGDEIADLALAFNHMKSNLRVSQQETARRQQLLLSLNKAAQAVGRAQTTDDVYQAVRDEILGLGYYPMIFEIAGDGGNLRLPKHLPSSLIQAVKKLTGASATGLEFSIQPGGLYDQAMKARDAILSTSFGDAVANSLPSDSLLLVKQVTRMLNMRTGILAPLIVKGETYGVLQVTGEDLTEGDRPAVSAFAHQTSIALENAATLQKLKASQAFLQTIYQAAAASIFTVNVSSEGVFRFAGLNPTCERLTGLKSDHVVGMRPQDLVPYIPPEAAAEIRSNYARCVDAGVAIEYEEMIPMDGRETWWLTRLTPLKDAAGRVIRIIGTSTDISLQIQVKEELRKQGEHLEELVSERTTQLVHTNLQLRAEVTQRKQVRKQVNRLLDRHVAINRLSLALGRINHLEEIYPLIFAHLQGLMDVDAFIISTLDREGERIRPKFAVIEGESADVDDWSPISLEAHGAGPQSRVIRTGEPVYLEDFRAAVVADRIEYAVRTDGEILAVPPPHGAQEAKTGCALLAPMEVEEQTVGVMQVQSFRPAAYSQDDLDLLVGIANVSSLAIEKARLYEAIQQELARRKQTESALRESERRYRTLFNQVPVGLYRTSPQGEFLDANQALARILGFPDPESLIHAPAPMLYVNPEDLEGWKSVLEKAGVVEQFEAPLYRQDGRVIWISHNGRRVQDGNGGVLHYEGAVMDITPRKNAQQKLGEYMQELERSNAELEQFAYVASHDLQEPLRMVSSYTQLLGRRYKGQLDSDADEFIAYAVDGANRMQRLINDLLTYSRINRRGMLFQEIDAAEALGQARLQLSAAVEECGALITHDKLPLVVADKRQLTQLLQNLIGNALKFHAEESPRVHISAEQEGAEWVFSVQDNGIGIDPEYHARIFEIFQRLHRRDEYPGTGIGLAISRRIVQRHGGRIWVESEPGSGSRFRFTIPFREGNLDKATSNSPKGEWQ